MVQKKMKMETIQDSFSHFIQQVPSRMLSTFMIWLDLKVSEFKVNGIMVLDEKLIQKPNWLSDNEIEIGSVDYDDERQENDSSPKISSDFMSDTNNTAPSPDPHLITKNAPFYILPSSPIKCLDTEDLSVSKENEQPLSPLNCALNPAVTEKHVDNDDCVIQQSDPGNKKGLLMHKENSPLSNGAALDQGQGHLLSATSSTQQNTTESSGSELLKSAELAVNKPNCESIGNNFSVECGIKEEILDLAYDLESEQCSQASHGAGLSVLRTVENGFDRTSFPFLLNYANLYNGGRDKNNTESSSEETDFQHLHQLYAKPSLYKADSEESVKSENCRQDCAIQQPGSKGHNHPNSVTTREQSVNPSDMTCVSRNVGKSKQETSTDCVLDYSNRNLKIKDKILSLNQGMSHASDIVEKTSQQKQAFELSLKNASSRLGRHHKYQLKDHQGENSETVSGDNNHPEMSINQQMFLLNQHHFLNSYQNDVSESSQTSDNQMAMATNFPLMLLNQGQSSYYNMAASQYGGAFAFNRRLMGSLRTPFKRQAWSQAEKAAVYKFLGGFIREMKIPGKSSIERAQKLCPILQARTWKNIKYQIYNIICSQKRKQQRRFLATLAVPERQSAYVIQSHSLCETGKMES